MTVVEGGFDKADDYIAAHEVLQQYKRDNNLDRNDTSFVYGPYDPPGQERHAQQAQRRQYEIYRGMNQDDIVVVFTAANDQEAMERLSRYRHEHPGQEYNANRARPENTVTNFTGTWLIKNANTGAVLHQISGIGNVQADANRHAAAWLRSQRPDADMSEIEVVPEMR